MTNLQSNLQTSHNLLLDYSLSSTGNVERFPFDKVFANVFGLPQDPQVFGRIIPVDGLQILFQYSSLSQNQKLKQEFALLALKSFSITDDGTVSTVRWIPKTVSGVSVVSALYQNNISELEEFLESVLKSFITLRANQKELILIDDRSDNIQEIRAKVLDFLPRFTQQDVDLKLIEKTENEGPGQTRNIGATLAVHNNIIFLDSDDLVHPLYFQLFAQELEAGTPYLSCDMVLPDGHIFCAAASSFEITISENGNGSCIGLRRDQPLISNLISSGRLYTQQKLDHYEDWELNLVLKGQGIPISILPIPLYYYRQKNSGRDSKKQHLQLISRFECIESAWQRLIQLSIENSSVPQEKYFFTAYQQLLQNYKTNFSSKGLTRFQYRKKMLLLLFKTFINLIWLDDRPACLSKVKTKVISALPPMSG